MNNLTYLYMICIFIRLLFLYITYICIRYNWINPTLFSIFYFVLGLSFMYQYISKNRTIGAFGQTVWWDYLRIVHAFIFIYASILIYYKNMSFIPLLISDVLIGLSGHIFHYYIKK